MITKQELLECSVVNFTTFGSKRFTMDELAQTLGISKKTIYKYYSSKEDLVVDSVSYLINTFKTTINKITHQEPDPLVCIIEIHSIAFNYLQHFTPSFIFGLKKYYPKANNAFDDFRHEVVNHIIYGLLHQAKTQNLIVAHVNIRLFCDLYFKRFEEVFLKEANLAKCYSHKELLNHFVVFNLKGIAVAEYSNSYF